jgi:hypothetical protein
MATGTAKKMPQSARLRTPEGRSCYAFVFSPATNDDDKQEYRIQILFPEAKEAEGIKILKDAAREVGIEAFGADFADQVRAGKIHWPFRKGDTDSATKDNPLYKGMTFLNAKSTDKPTVVDENVEEIDNREDFRSGDWCKLSIRFFAFDRKGNKGVAVSLGNIQRTRRDTRLDNRADAKTEFEKIPGGTGAGNSAASDFDDL